MSDSYTDLLDSVDASRKGLKVGAFFDLDKTIIACFSAFYLLKEQVRAKQITSLDAAVQLAAAVAFEATGKISFDDVIKTSVSACAGLEEDDFAAIGQRIFEKVLVKKIYPEAAELIARHKRMGHCIVMVSSATRYQIEPVSDLLGVTDILCSELELSEGKLTGNLAGPPCFGGQKLVATEAFAKKHKINLNNSFFYTDSHTDTALLERVGNARPVNPDKKLAQIARDNNWMVCDFNSRKKPSFVDYARTGVMYATLLPSSLIGSYNYLFSQDKKKSAQIAFNSFVNLFMLASGITVNVKGRENLWKQRPALFVSNHQSILDGYITPYLIQSDYVAIGKKEARNLPFLGKMMEDSGFIMFDRSSKNAGREASEACVQALLNGDSVMMAAEGTRSPTPSLLPFKKGVFHIATQAGVPIVPVVIKNAYEILPPGEVIPRTGTVEVEVLEPIDTSNWKKETMEDHIADLRDRFLVALDQTDR